jgi:polar amino acid transport system substrate-binding protein
MEQLTQELKSGKMEIMEVPFPILEPDGILVRNHYSVISAGTESKTVTDARKGYIAKARSRQKEVKMVLNSIKTEGLKKTYDVVMNKLNAPAPLGYSCAGEVIALGENIKDIKVGDYVACGGGGAVHADVVAVTRNLCVKVNKDIDLRHAALTTIASIAIQGIRQADLRFGENCVVIGLGLIGQLTIQILKASGIKAIGVDIDDEQVKAAKENGAYLAFNRNQSGIVESIEQATNGFGTDAVIITAGTSSLDPVEFAGQVARKKGKVVVVGAVPTGFSRPNYYKKELDLRMSSSYGPGRYDNDYELKGRDYPIGYVRFTENRNMQTFVDFLEQGVLQIDKLISHEFDLSEAKNAYQMILDKSERFSGILLKYDTEKELKKSVQLNKKTFSASDVNVGFIGAGNFAQNAILPRIDGKCSFVGVSTTQGNMSNYVGNKYKFAYSTDDADQILKDKDVNTIFVLTRHNLHAAFVSKALEAGKVVFVEKPLAMNLEELEMVKKSYVENNGRLMLGFNRRFSPLTREMTRKMLPNQMKAINIRVNAGIVPSDHWVHDPDFGGGRIIGEACHFIDLAMHIADSPISSVSAFATNDANALMDTLVVNLMFENGSIASVNYLSNGNKNVPKERIEVFCDGTVYEIDDFKKMTSYGNSTQVKKLNGQDKGHSNELIAFIDSVKNGKEMPISFDEIYLSTLVTLKAIESIKSGRTIQIKTD